MLRGDVMVIVLFDVGGGGVINVKGMFCFMGRIIVLCEVLVVEVIV